MEEINVMYFHGKTVDGARFTIAGVVKDNVLDLGISVCSKVDQFNKAKGRNIATGRVLSQRNINSGRSWYPVVNFDGWEIKGFTSMVKNFNFFTKKELQQEFGLLRQ